MSLIWLCRSNVTKVKQIKLLSLKIKQRDMNEYGSAIVDGQMELVTVNEDTKY